MSKTFKIKVDKIKTRNVVAVAAWNRTGAGAHTSKKYSRKIKHRNRCEF